MAEGEAEEKGKSGKPGGKRQASQNPAFLIFSLLNDMIANPEEYSDKSRCECPGENRESCPFSETYHNDTRDRLLEGNYDAFLA